MQYLSFICIEQADYVILIRQYLLDYTTNTGVVASIMIMDCYRQILMPLTATSPYAILRFVLIEA